MIMFTLTEEENVLVDKWVTEHNKKCNKSTGAIGGKYSYIFTPTGLGVFARIVCNNCDCYYEINDVSNL